MWSQMTLVTDADLGSIEPAATEATRPWGADTWPDAIAEAMKDLRIWIDLAYPDVVSASDCVSDRWNFNYVWAWNGASYTNEWSAQARDDNERDIDLAAVLATTDARLACGSTFEHDGIRVKVDGANTNAATLVVEYYGAKGWTAITVDDGTAVDGKTLARSGRIKIVTTPTDWEPVRLMLGAEFLWLRFGIATGSLSAGTKATQIVAIKPPLALKRAAQFLAMAYVKRGLATGAAEPDLWLTSATQYENKARTLFETLRDRGLALDIDRTGAIAPQTNERTESSPVRLRRG